MRICLRSRAFFYVTDALSQSSAITRTFLRAEQMGQPLGVLAGSDGWRCRVRADARVHFLLEALAEPLEGRRQLQPKLRG